VTQAAPAILTLASAVEWPHVFAFMSLLVALASIAVAVLKLLDGRLAKAREATEAEREKRAEDRHGELCGKIEIAHTRVTETKKAIEEFRGEASREFAALHRRDAELALDLERRVAPIEGKLGIGRVGGVAEISGKAGR
jgi:hypothetical protein